MFFPKCCRLKTYLPKLIHMDQIGFVKKCLSLDNLHRLLHIFDASSETTAPWAVLSLHAEEAFDRLEWPHLWPVLKHGNRLQLMIKICQSLNGLGLSLFDLLFFVPVTPPHTFFSDKTK